MYSYLLFNDEKLKDNSKAFERLGDEDIYLV